MFCSECGLEVNSSSKFCANCGAKVASNVPKIDIQELTNHLIDSHLQLLGGYGAEPSDRAVIEEALTKIFNEVHSKTIGGNLFEYEPTTRFCNCETTDEIDVVGPIVVDVILKSDKIKQSIRPCISTFLNWFVLEVNIPISHHTKHLMFLANLEDKLSDANLHFFGLTNYSELVKVFYMTTFPEGKDEFFSCLKSIADQSQPGDIEALPERQSPFELGADRKEYWKIIADNYHQRFYPVITTVREILTSNEWLGEYLPFLESHLGTFLSGEFVSVIQCHEMVTGNKSPTSGKDKILLFSDFGICEIYTKEKHRRGTAPVFYPREQIDEISIGTEVHESHGGFSSNVSTFSVISIRTKSHQLHTKYVYMGENEHELNVNRPKLMTKLTQLSSYYPLAEGDVVQSASGYTLSPSIGIWHPIN